MDSIEREELILIAEINFAIIREELMYIKSKHADLNFRIWSTIKAEERYIHELEMEADVLELKEGIDKKTLEKERQEISEEIAARKETVKWFLDSPVWKGWLESLAEQKEYEELLLDMERSWAAYLEKNPL